MDEKGGQQMNNARAYMKEICRALASWEEWLQNAESMIKEGDKQLLLRFIEHQTAQLRRLDAEKVKDDLLEHDDGIARRLERLETDYQLLATARHISATKDTPAQTTDAEVNAAIDRCRQVVALKTWEVIRVFEDCRKRLPSENNPILTAALENRILLAIFGTKNELKDFVLYCQQAKNGTEMARRAAELYCEDKIKYDYLNSVLHGKLKEIGLKVGEYNAWKTETRKTRQRLGK